MSEDQEYGSGAGKRLVKEGAYAVSGAILGGLAIEAVQNPEFLQDLPQYAEAARELMSNTPAVIMASWVGLRGLGATAGKIFGDRPPTGDIRTETYVDTDLQDQVAKEEASWLSRLGGKDSAR